MTIARRSPVREWLWPYGVLVVFVLLIRVLPAITKPAVAEDDCERVSRSDRAALERCAAIHADDAEILIDLGEWYQNAGDRRRAHSLYAAALTIDPGDAEVRRRLDAVR